MTQPPVRLRRIDAPLLGEGELLRVRHTLLPLRWWRRVPVLREVHHELTIFERYLLEMAIELGGISSDDIAEVLPFPPEFAPRFLASGAWRLTAAGALHPDGDRYQVDPVQARRMLDSKVVPVRVPSTADFVLLPRTGDLLAVASGRGSWLTEADRRLRPQTMAPVPAGLWPRRRAEYLAERVRTGDLAGSDREIAEVVVPESGDEALLPSLRLSPPKRESLDGGSPDGGGTVPRSEPAPSVKGCPAYRCSALVRESAAGIAVEAQLTEPHGNDTGRAARSQHTLTADLTGAAALVASWQELLDALDTEQELQRAWEQVAPAAGEFERASRKGSSTWVFYVGGAAAEAIDAAGQSLIEPAGLEISRAETAVAAQAVLAPADEAADALFARDRVVTSLLAVPDPAARIGPACAAAVGELGGTDTATRLLTETAVRERSWRLRHYRLVCDLREAEDFGYE